MVSKPECLWLRGGSGDRGTVRSKARCVVHSWLVVRSFIRHLLGASHAPGSLLSTRTGGLGAHSSGQRGSEPGLWPARVRAAPRSECASRCPGGCVHASGPCSGRSPSVTRRSPNVAGPEALLPPVPGILLLDFREKRSMLSHVELCQPHAFY